MTRIEWNGGECPVKPGTPIYIWFRYDRSKSIEPCVEPEALRWSHLKSDTLAGLGDIVAYEIVTP